MVGGWGVKQKKKRIAREPSRRSYCLTAQDPAQHTSPSPGNFSPSPPETHPPELFMPPFPVIPVSGHVQAGLLVAAEVCEANLVSGHVQSSASVLVDVPDANLDVEEEFLDSHENFHEPRS
jgi:hypothetical protein